MVESLVIVESPAKTKTIGKILGKKFKVTSSMGHLIDLPKSTLGVDVEHGFKPSLIIMRDKQSVLSKIKKEVEKKKNIYVATDPDREGEAIGWNIVQQIGKDKNIFRVTFQEITKTAVQKAFEHPREFDIKKIDAQTARRVLDRLVGYKISPLLWKKVGSRLSAGRVQSVALRLIVERERAIAAFIPSEYWQIAVDLRKDGCEGFLTAALERVNSEKVEIKNQQEAESLAAEIAKEQFGISSITEKEIRRNPNAPYITSTLQQDAFNRLGFNANRTMSIAQQLYEGIELGEQEVVGLITYMRTDSFNVSQEAIHAVRDFIKSRHGDQYLPETPFAYKSKKSAQEAHEAIRPADILKTPAEVEPFLDKDQWKLYELIWKRFVCSQMMPAVFLNRKLEINAGKFTFGVSGSTCLFDGFLSVMRDEEEEKTVDFSQYAQGDTLHLMEVKPTQHFTKPPAHFTDASLVKALEEEGIGRPSTYASIIQTLVNRNYIIRDNRYFVATNLGMRICDLLIEYFPKIMDVGFTARMEEHLDLVEEGNLDYVSLLTEFYKPFKEDLDYATENMKKNQEFVDQHCPHCGRQMVVKWGRKGKFLSCSGFPECKFAQPFLSGVKCPEPNCTGELVERRSGGGRKFYGCSQYPQCRYTASKLPENNNSA